MKAKHKKRIALAAGLLTAAAVSCGAFAAVSSRTIRIDPEKADTRIFEGWGTSLCWWANRIGYSDTLAQQSADLFFGPDGLRMNIMRYNIGGGDNPTHTYIARIDSAAPGLLA